MLLVVHNYYLFALLLIHSFRTSICVCKYLYMLSVTFDDRGQGWGGAYNPDFSVDLSRSRANFRSPEILYIFRINSYTSQADANSSFSSWLPGAGGLFTEVPSYDQLLNVHSHFDQLIPVG